MFPDGSTGAMTVLGMICPLVKLRLDASGRPLAHGYTVTYPPSFPTSGSTTVTFKSTALMPVLGRPPLPRTLNTVAVSVPLRLPIFPVGRVFIIRDGVKVVSEEPVGK